MVNLICNECGATHTPDFRGWRCPCGGPLDVRFEAKFPLSALKDRAPGLWRYREALPISEKTEPVSLGETMTPLTPLEIEGVRVLAKLDFLFPTGSFKDRGAAVMLTRMKELGVQEAVEDSSGNAAAAVSAYSARAGIRCRIYVPEGTSPAKLYQTAAYGAQVFQVPGGRQATADAAMAAAAESYYASHYWNPFFNQGVKTFAFELWEQLGRREPDAVVVPAGHGSMALGCYLGFSDLLSAGLISRLPAIMVVQAAACAPLYRIWAEDLDHLPDIAQEPTLAEGISITRPVRWRQIKEAVVRTKGRVVVVHDEELPAMLSALASRGIYAEPTSAAAPAGVVHLIREGYIRSGQTVVVPLTGHGLKAADKISHLIHGQE